MFEFGFAAMNGFWSGIVGFGIGLLGSAGRPVSVGIDGVPGSTIGAAEALPAAVSAATTATINRTDFLGTMLPPTPLNPPAPASERRPFNGLLILCQ